MLLRLAVPDKTFIGDTLASYVGGITAFFGAFGIDLLTNYRSIYTMIAGVVGPRCKPMAVPENKNAYEQFVNSTLRDLRLFSCSQRIKCEKQTHTECEDNLFK